MDVLWGQYGGQYGWGFRLALMCQRKPNTDRESLPTGDGFDLRKKEGRRRNEKEGGGWKEEEERMGGHLLVHI